MEWVSFFGKPLRVVLPHWVSTMAANLDADVQARIAALKAEREALDAELAGVRLQRQEFSAP
jgi:hypothetical protein